MVGEIGIRENERQPLRLELPAINALAFSWHVAELCVVIAPRGIGVDFAMIIDDNNARAMACGAHYVA